MTKWVGLRTRIPGSLEVFHVILGCDEPASILGPGGRSKINLSQSRHNITTERSFCPERGQRWLKLISNCRPKIWLTVSHGQTGKNGNSLVALRGFLEVVTLQKYDKSGQHNSLHKNKPTRNCTQMTWFWFIYRRKPYHTLKCFFLWSCVFSQVAVSKYWQ